MVLKKRKFLFRCKSCKMIISVEFTDQADIIDTEEDKMVLECTCGAHSYVLRD